MIKYGFVSFRMLIIVIYSMCIAIYGFSNFPKLTTVMATYGRIGLSYI